MNTALDAPCVDVRGKQVPPAKYATYLNDVTTGAPDLEECWQQTLIVIAQLALCNLPIGIWKCDFLTTCLVVMGHTIFRREQQLAAKTIWKLFLTNLPRTLA